MSAPVIQTERLTLRGYRLSDYEAYRAFWTSPRAQHMGGPFNEIGAWESFCSEAGQWQIRGFGVWMAALRDGDRPVGCAGFNFPIRYDEPELVWALFEGFEGQGYAQEAAQAARSCGARSYGIDRPASFIAQQNHRSVALAQRLGAALEDTVEDGGETCCVYRHPAPGALQ